MRALRLLQAGVGVTGMAIAVVARAGPPFTTDDPEPVEPGKWEINSAITGSWGGGQASAGTPSIDLNYGAAPGVQLHAQPRFAYARDSSGSRRGLDDTEVGVKYRFFELGADGAKTQAGIYPMYQLPTGARRLGEDRGTHGVFLPLWVQEDIGKWTAYGGVGYRLNRAPEGRNSVFRGLTVLYKISEELQLGGETFTESPVADGERRTNGMNVGGALRLTDCLSLLFSAGRATGTIPQRLAYLGVQAHF